MDVNSEWSEEDSVLYQEIASVAVPAREEQIATILTLLPSATGDRFRAIELGCGPGILSYALLDGFPKASVIALDGSPAMRACAANLLANFGDRASVEPFDLESVEWLLRVQSADAVVSSLCLHHLAGAERQRLFNEIYDRMSPQGALIIADLVEPQRPEAKALFAATWDLSVQAQSKSEACSNHLYEKFAQAQWNYYRFPDPIDKPSPLFDQLNWLKSAGFEGVDCFWLRAGHAIYGGYKSPSSHPSGTLAFEDAVRSAGRAISKLGGE